MFQMQLDAVCRLLLTLEVLKVNISATNRKIKFALTISLVLFSTASLANSQTPAIQPSFLTQTQTKEAERLLAQLGYWTGPIDGLLDPTSQSALIAFQKWENRQTTGHLTVDELEMIRVSTSPKPRDAGYEHVEIDLDRQILLLVNREGRVKVLPVSTGNGKEFIDEGQTSVAYTPRGRFIVYDKISGWEKGPIGSMFYPSYISGGIAIHGSRNVPTQPESHGCIRIPLLIARQVSQLMPEGTIVLVYDKVSFVSAKAWAENPKLKELASIE